MWLGAAEMEIYMQKFQAKRLTAWLLTFLMLISVMPMSILAEADYGIATTATDETIYVLAGSDWQYNSDNHTQTATRMKAIMNKIKETYSSFDGFLFAGDYNVQYGSDSSTNSGIDAFMSATQAVFSELNHTNSILVQGNHDTKVDNIDATGGHDFDGYSVYVLNEDDYPAWDNSDGNGKCTEDAIKTLASDLETWLDAKIAGGDNDPIFVTAHIGLSYTTRTSVKGDGQYAKYIFDVLNTAGKELNIVYLFGHNHSSGYDEWLGGEAIYLPAGDTMPVAEVGETDSWTTETLNFTYMNAGYVGYYDVDGYTGTGDDGKLTMTVFKIEDSKITVERYNDEGLYDLKKAGDTTGTYADRAPDADTQVWGSPQTITRKSISQDTSTEDTGKGDTDQVESSWVEIPATSATASEWVETTTIVAGQTYILMNTYYDSSKADVRYAMNNNSSNSIEAYTIDMALTGTSFADSTDLPSSIKWVAVESPLDGYFYFRTLEQVNGSYRYLMLGNNDGEETEAVLSTLRTSSYNWGNGSVDHRYYGWKISSTNNGLLASANDGGATYHLRYSYTDSTFMGDNEWPDSSEVRPYVLQEGSESTATRYAMLEGAKTYMVAEGATEAEIIAAVQAGITGYVADDANGTNKTTLADSDLTWAVSGDATGGYVVTASYQGIELGSANVTVNVVAGTGSTNGWVLVKDPVGGTEGSTTYSYEYTLDTDGVNPGENYLIVGSSNAYAMANSGSDLSAESVSIDGNTVKYTSPTSLADCIGPEWTITADNKITNGTYWLAFGGNWYARELTLVTSESEATAWTIGHSGSGSYTISYTSNRVTYYLRYDSNSFSIFSVKSTVRLYGGRQNATVTDPGTAGTPGEYAKLEGTTEYTISVGSKTEAEILAMIQDGLTVYTNTSESDDGKTALEDSDSRISWTWNGTIDPNTVGNYTMTVSCDGEVLGTVNVCIQTKVVTNVVFPTEGYVQQYSAQSQTVTDKDGNPLYVEIYYEGETEPTKIPLTLSMLTLAVNTKEVKDITGLTITYAGMTEDNFTLHITEKQVNNYPEYPDQGAVKVNKTATGIDFQSSGIAQVELSTSGVPSKKGADVIIMLDTSSSMKKYTVSDGRTRLAVLQESLEELINQFKTPGADGELLDIRLAIADFNGFTGYDTGITGTYVDREQNDTMSDGYIWDGSTRPNKGVVYTGHNAGSNKLDADAFVDAVDVAVPELTTASGTNYDYAMDAIYQLGAAIKAQNEAVGEERDLYVIFMSDGATYQWNGFSSDYYSTLWGDWITGGYTAENLIENLNENTTHSDFYDFNDHDEDGEINEHRVANAIKGDPSEEFEVVRKNTGDSDCLVNLPGLGAKMFSIGFGISNDQQVKKEDIITSLKSIASIDEGATSYFYSVNTAEELSAAFNVIGSEIAYAATNAVFKDKMGENFNLQIGNHTYLPYGETDESKTVTLESKIEVLTYNIYTRAEWIADGSIADDLNKIGTRQDSGTVIETVTFNADGTEAYSDQIGGGTINILAPADLNAAGEDVSLDTTTDQTVVYKKGVIYAKNFLYNTNSAAVTTQIGGTEAGTAVTTDITVDAESFYWNIGTILTSEQALRYYVYLDGSMEGTKDAGAYATNEYATLYYDNYLGNPCEKPTVSPVMAWQSAHVSYAFYLVDSNGKPIVNQTSGHTGSFANKIAVTSPVFYEKILLNNIEEYSVIEIKDVAGNILPAGYELYDESATYKLTIRSNATGGWDITYDSNKTQSTYVMDFDKDDAAAFSNAVSTSNATNANYDYTHTVVWFAVLWNPQALPDTVVIDYGVPVDIHVLTNDMFGDNGKLAGIAKYDATAHEDLLAQVPDATKGVGQSIATGFTTFATGTYGTATANTTTGIVTYTLNTSNGMQMSEAEKFTYAVNFTSDTNGGYYYDIVTIIPATTIYYEEKFVSFTDSTAATDTATYGKWVEVGTTVDATQGEDRPGKYSLPEVDANNVYGYDGINNSATTYSLGSAMKVNVDSATGKPSTCPVASFTFTGTGFDLISLTDNTSGTIFVDVYSDADHKNLVKQKIVDNYYGYKYENGEWSVDTESKDVIYQVPVIKMTKDDLGAYGTYYVTIRVAYITSFDHVGDGQYTFVLDSIRIYDPADPGDKDYEKIKDAYVSDGEYNPTYVMIKDAILEGLSVTEDTNDVLNGSVFIDGVDDTDDPYLYKNPGPNNEAYLTNGQSLTFKLGTNFKPDKTMIGMKLASGSFAKLKVTYTTKNNKGEDVNVELFTNNEGITTVTDMYYDVIPSNLWSQDTSGYVTPVITITCVAEGDSILSLTNIKVTEKASDDVENTTTDSDGTTTAYYFNLDDGIVTLSTNGIEGLTLTAEEENAVWFIADEDVFKAAYAIANPAFEPEYLEFKTQTIGFGRWVRGEYVLAVTSSDVASLTVNGEAIEPATADEVKSAFGSLWLLEKSFGVDIDGEGYTMWLYKSDSDTDYEIIASDENGNESEPVNTADSDSTVGGGILDWFTGELESAAEEFKNSDVYKRMEELAERVFDPENFEAEIKKLADGRHQLIVEASEDVEYVIVDGEIIGHYITETVIDLSNNGEETVKRVFVKDIDDSADTDADGDSAEEDEEIEVSAYDRRGFGSRSRRAKRH